jgi:FAD:protein FMN transferase
MRNAVQTMSEARAARYVMGTVVEIVAWGRDEHSAVATAVNRAMDEFERLEKIFSRFDPASELSRLNRAPRNQATFVSEEFFDVVSRGVAYSSESLGSFSITLLPLTELWQRCAAEARHPEAGEIERTRNLCEPDLILLDRHSQTVTLRGAGVGLDLGGLVKGLAVDRAISLLKSSGVDRAFVNAGSSSIAAFGASHNSEWRIGVRHPFQSDRLIGTISVTNAALSSSGTYERSLGSGGCRYSHVIDPRSGLPSERLIGTTVVTDCATRAEVMSKMLLVMDCEAAFARFDELAWPAEGLAISTSPDGSLVVRRSEGLRGFQQSESL